MQPARRIHHSRNTTRLQRKRRLLKLALHIALAKVSQVAALARAAAVRLGDRQVLQRRLAAGDALLVRLDDCLRVLLGARNGCLWDNLVAYTLAELLLLLLLWWW